MARIALEWKDNFAFQKEYWNEKDLSRFNKDQYGGYVLFSHSYEIDK